MVRLPCHDNEKGLTLVELLVALGLTGLVLVLVVTGSLFVQKFIADWSDRDKVTEELAFLSREFVPKIEDCRNLETRGDTIIFHDTGYGSFVYVRNSGVLSRSDRPLSRSGLRVEAVDISVPGLPNQPFSDTLLQEALPRGLYQLKLTVSDQRGNRDSLLTTVRNNYEYFKYSQK
jgi:hypothetical protein